MPENGRVKILVIGAGPGGYAAAFLASDLGLEVAMVDPEEQPGGVCLYRGCIPSKAFLHAAQVIADARLAREFGVEFNEPKIDINKVRTWKDQVVARHTRGLEHLCKSRQIEYIRGRASFLNSQTVNVRGADGKEQKIEYENAILATGSQPAMLPLAPSSPRVMNSTGALELKDVPGRLLVIGGGYIGLELGTVYGELGSKVSVVEMADHILPGVDRDLSGVLQKQLARKFESIRLNTKVTKMTEKDKGLEVELKDAGGNVSKEVYDKVLIAVGREPDTKDLGLENTQAEMDEQGFVRVDEQRRTTDPAIFAIGDIAGRPMLAHKASYEGRLVAAVLAGQNRVYDPKAIPAVVFTDPEIAWCGLTEHEAREKERPVKVLKFPWSASGRATTLGRNDGLTKLILDWDTERVLGVGLAGYDCGELISEGVLAVEMGAVAYDLNMSIHPHPTLSETIMEAAQSASDWSLDH